jgi:CRP/FNR family cyclic AMP-dependent transcriptional regulator
VTDADDLWNGLEWARVLELDAELRALVDPVQQAAAARASAARVVRPPLGPWSGGPRTGGMGQLVLSGLILRRSGWGDRIGAELLGQGDLIRPWEHESDPASSVELRQEWRVLAPSSLAVLDATWSRRMAPWPELSAGLAARALARARRSVDLMAIDQIRQLDQRVCLLLWHLADRFGQVHLDGVHLELPLTHQQLGELAGARRPSLSAALSRLVRTGQVRQDDEGWILTGPPPVPALAPDEPRQRA